MTEQEFRPFLARFHSYDEMGCAAMTMTRRRFLQAAGGGTAASLLAGCGGAGAKGSAAQDARVTLPRYLPFTGVRPDLPGTAAGILPGYFRYPAQPKTTLHKPASGLSSISAVTNTYDPAPPPLGRNEYWQEINNRLGAKLTLDLVTSEDYATKFSTIVAAGDVPDLVLIPGNLRSEPQLLQKVFADLSGHLSGDGIKDYPYLANIPTDGWRNTVFAGGIYGIPLSRPVAGQVMFTRQKLIQATGMSDQPKTYEEFFELCKALTDPKSNRWAVVLDPTGSTLPQFVQESVGAPNGWTEHNGTFTSAVETDEMKRALGLVRDLVKAGVTYPDGFSANRDQVRQWFGAGRVAMQMDGFLAWDMFLQGYGDDIGGMVAPLHGGSGFRHFAGPATYAITAVKKGASGRVKRILEACNWLSAPFGTAEYLLRKWGTEGVHFTWKNGLPQRTTTGTNEIRLELQYIADAPYVLGPNDEQIVRREYDYQKNAVAGAVKNPAAGYFSDNAVRNGTDLGAIISDAQLKIWRGQQPLSSWDDAVKDWRKNGGDAVRRDYEKAYQKQGPV